MSKTRKKREINREEQILKVLNKSRGENPLIPIMLDMFEAALQKQPSHQDTDLARIYNRLVLNRFPQSTLETIVKNYRSLPISLQKRIAPRRANNRNFNPNPRVKISTNGRVAVVKDKVSPSPHEDKFPILDMFDPNYMTHLVAELGYSVYGDENLFKVPLPLNLDNIDPYIGKITPKNKNNEYKPGEIIRLHVRHPATESPSYEVIVSNTYQDIETKHILENDRYKVTPIVSNLSKDKRSAILEITLPTDFMDGHVRFSVNSIESKMIPINAVLVPPPTVISQAILGSPEIISISPDAQQFPGNKIILNVRNLGNVTVLDKGKLSDGNPIINSSIISTNPSLSLISSADSGNKMSLSFTVIKPCSEEEGIGQIQTTIPINCVPGLYWFQLTNYPLQVFLPLSVRYEYQSLAVDFTVRPHKYRVNFTTIHCIDESDYETVLGWNTVHDEIITQWSVYADQDGWSKSTSEYEGFDDGVTKAYNGVDSSVFKIDGSFGDVKIALGIMTYLYESNETDTAQTQGVLNVIGDLGVELGKLLFVLGAPTAAAIATATGEVANAVASIVGMFGGGYNFLGQQPLVWSAVELQERTNNPQNQFSEAKDFINDDDTGSYSVSCTITRLNQ